MITLTVEPRDVKTKGALSPAKLRKGGKMPAVFYGPKEKATSVAINAIEFAKVFKKAGESSVIILKVAGAPAGHDEHEVLIHDVDKHPVTGTARHADFYVIEKGKKVSVEVPLIFTGVSSAVKDLGGILVKVLRTIEVEAAPKDLPHELTVDLSALKEFTSVIHVSDIALPAGAVAKTSPDEVVASIAVAKEEVEEAPVAVDMSTIEVEKKGKEAKPAEEGAEAGAGDKGGEAKK